MSTAPDEARGTCGTLPAHLHRRGCSVYAPQQVQCECGHDAGSHNALKFNCMATTAGTHATRCPCKAFGEPVSAPPTEQADGN